MSNYTKSTNFASKDSLSPGSALKIVKGTEIDTEFNNIATAVATKVDSSGGTLTSPTITTPTINGMSSSIITAGTAVTTTSGTTVDFTGIPSWVKRVTLAFSGLSLSGNASFLFQLGTSGGIVSTGYSGYSVRITNSSTPTAATLSTGFILAEGQAGDVSSGTIVFVQVSGNTWAATSILGGSNYCSYMGGSLALSSTLTQVRLTTSNGTDTFDAGSINILYE